MGRRTDGDHEVQKFPFQQGRESLSLLQTAHDVAQPMSLRKQGLSRGKQLQIRALQTRNGIRRRLLRTWGHEFPHEAGALIKVYWEALRVVNSISPSPQMLNTPIRCKPDEKWLNMNPVHPPETQPVQAATPGTIPSALTKRFRPFRH